MATVLKAQSRTINLKNVTHIQVFPDATLVYPAGFYTIRLVGEDSAKAVELARAAGFVGSDELMINPERLVVAEAEQATARLMMDGYQKQLIVPAKFIAYLEPAQSEPVAEAPAPKVSSAGKSETTNTSRTRKKASE